jgi:hypothetical protein
MPHGVGVDTAPLERQAQVIRTRKLGLDPDLVLYSGRHTFATDMLDRTGNLNWLAIFSVINRRSPQLGTCTLAEGRGGDRQTTGI